MKKPKKIFIPSSRWAFVAGEARRKRPRFVLIWWGRQTKKLKFCRSRQVLSGGRKKSGNPPRVNRPRQEIIAHRAVRGGDIPKKGIIHSD
jgi:hypothetical protein